MSKYFVVRCFHLAALLIGPALFSPIPVAAQTSALTAPAPGDFRIAGTVVNALSGSPLARTRVTIQDTRNQQRFAWTITSDDGRFEFNRLAAGKFAMQGAKRGFIPSNYDQHGQFSTAIVTGVSLDTEHLVLRLAPQASLSGKVLNEAGEPVRQASVSLYTEDRRIGVGRIQKVRQDRTDDQGSYEFAPLDVGTYFLAVTATPWYAVHPTSSASRPESTSGFDPSLDAAYPVTYYQDAVDPDEASPILIRGGDHIEADIHVSPVPALHLLFHVPDGGKNGFTWPIFRKSSFDGMESVPANGVRMISPDVVEVEGVPAGRYTVLMPSQQGESTQRSEIEMDLTADGQELDTSKGEAAGNIKASLKLLGEEALPRQLAVLLRNSKLRVVAYQQPDKNGEFEFSAVAPGRYEVLAQTPGKAYSVVHISSQGRENSGHFLDVSPGASITISLTLVGGVTNVEGVAKLKGQPVAGAMVVLIPESSESNRELFRRDQSDLDGTFTLQNVVPGRYTVCAIENGWDLDWAKPAVILHYCQHGSPLVVTNEKRASLQLQSAVEVQSK